MIAMTSHTPPATQSGATAGMSGSTIPTRKKANRPTILVAPLSTPITPEACLPSRKSNPLPATVPTMRTANQGHAHQDISKTLVPNWSWPYEDRRPLHRAHCASTERTWRMPTPATAGSALNTRAAGWYARVRWASSVHTTQKRRSPGGGRKPAHATSRRRSMRPLASHPFTGRTGVGRTLTSVAKGHPTSASSTGSPRWAARYSESLPFLIHESL
jgi:hypothetical protein